METGAVEPAKSAAVETAAGESAKSAPMAPATGRATMAPTTGGRAAMPPATGGRAAIATADPAGVGATANDDTPSGRWSRLVIVPGGRLAVGVIAVSGVTSADRHAVTRVRVTPGTRGVTAGRAAIAPAAVTAGRAAMPPAAVTGGPGAMGTRRKRVR